MTLPSRMGSFTKWWRQAIGSYLLPSRQFATTARFNIDADYDAVAYSVPVKREWRDAVLEAIGTTEASYSPAHRSAPRREAKPLAGKPDGTGAG